MPHNLITIRNQILRNPFSRSDNVDMRFGVFCPRTARLLFPVLFVLSQGLHTVSQTTRLSPYSLSIIQVT
jgi:hypothetical protein